MGELGPSLRSVDLWARRERQCLQILQRALVLMRENGDAPESEVELNRKLYFLLLTANHELYPENDIPPIPEGNNQPDPNDKQRTRREGKRPDFQWIYIDRYEENPEHSSKQFVVECKRVGASSRSDWILNANYINHGVNRFRDAEWGYAKRFPSGAMIGYWQNMEAEQILHEIHTEGRKQSIPDLVLNGAWVMGGVSLLNHTFNRPFEVTPFNLHHLWIDLRYQDEGSRESALHLESTQ